VLVSIITPGWRGASQAKSVYTSPAETGPLFLRGKEVDLKQPWSDLDHTGWDLHFSSMVIRTQPSNKSKEYGVSGLLKAHTGGT